jgi:enoyl-CoA hydratase/carnithine racemase
MTPAVLYTREGDIVTLTLNRPETRNAISDHDMVDAIVAALERLSADDARVAILTGAAPAFSSGGNIKTFGAATAGRAPVETRRYYVQGIQRIPLAFERLEVPVIAAVNGPAIGAGCDLACMCDLRIASQSARFAESFVKLGLIPGDGGAWLLQRAVGYAKAAEMSLTGDTIDAAEALACGLVSQVLPDAQLMDAARALALRIAANPPHAVRMTKKLLQQARQARLDEVLQHAAALQSLMHVTADHAEAVAAMLAKRPPVFRGG